MNYQVNICMQSNGTEIEINFTDLYSDNRQKYKYLKLQECMSMRNYQSLKMLELASSGINRCEIIADAPLFQTDTKQSYILTVASGTVSRSDDLLANDGQDADSTSPGLDSFTYRATHFPLLKYPK